MAWYIDSKNVKKNTNEKANAKYEKNLETRRKT